MRTRVKFCGITRVEDALAAVRLGADAIGLVFYEASPRCVTLEQAQEITRMLPPFVTAVGLFVDVLERQIRGAIESCGVQVLQFHGNEPAATYAAFGRPYIKAIRMAADIDLHAEQQAYPDAAAFLLDSHVAGTPGGSGETFDWRRIPRNLEKPVILAGGLTAQNVQQAISLVRPFAVDVSSGVEKTKGVKDIDKMAAFIESVRACQ
jgi:phosphoribosylanthranilate isomerase